MVFPCVYINNNRKTTHLYFRSLNIIITDQILLAYKKKRIRQLTIYEMTEQQSNYLISFAPWIQILTLHVNTLECLFTSNHWFYHLLTDMTSLFSLTIYYPKYTKDYKLNNLLANSLLNLKKHFFIKCNDGILNIWL